MRFVAFFVVAASALTSLPLQRAPARSAVATLQRTTAPVACLPDEEPQEPQEPREPFPALVDALISGFSVLFLPIIFGVGLALAAPQRRARRAERETMRELDRGAELRRR